MNPKNKRLFIRAFTSIYILLGYLCVLAMLICQLLAETMAERHFYMTVAIFFLIMANDVRNAEKRS